ncbi:Na+-transporting methylmalonyl-CoA/oxaloacetate decarboxylase subunit beta [Opitutaceae bacterium TAV5]|nr:Na+-transporting methylmalonyl-CoA/oxaloacetate decarboxylase subunit beta [Opitutaceae bacterium TAV5]
MNFHDILNIFQGVTTLLDSDTPILITRIGLIFLGMLLVYLGKKGTLEPLLMIPMGLAMCAVNAGVLFLDPTTAGHIVHGSAPLADPVAQQQAAELAASGQMHGTLFMSPLVEEPTRLIGLMQIDFLQPIFTFAFSNNLIACLVFMGIGVLLDVGFVLARPFLSISMALFCELGTIVTFPIAVAMGFTYGEAASIALVGGADGPMVLFGALKMAKHLLVPITIIAYLYLGLVYGGYPYLIRALIPAKLRGLKMPARPVAKITSGEKLAFAVVACTVLCLLFPSAAPLFFSLFLGVAVREAGLKVFSSMIESVFLYGATMFLGVLLGIMCEASTILDPKVVLLLILGILSLLLSGVGGIIGGYVAYLASGRKINPVIGIAGVSCVPSTAKVVQKEVSKARPDVIVLPEALGANISGVITTAILTGIYVTLIPLLSQ